MSENSASVIECPCGAVIEGESSSAVAGKAQTHAKQTHGTELSWDQALAMARPA